MVFYSWHRAPAKTTTQHHCAHLATLNNYNFLFYCLNIQIRHTILYYLGKINFIMLHDELPPVQHPIHYTFQKKITY